MAHVTQMYFLQNVRHFFPRHFKQTKVLEIGSLNINGSVRVFFEGCDYTGIDIGPGDCVDLVCKGEDFAGPSGDYDTLVSTEVFEHTENWDTIFLNMLRLMKRDGMVVFTCAGYGRPQHGTRFAEPHAAPHVSGTTDYYRNLRAKDFQDAFRLEHWFASHAFVEDFGSLYFVGLGRANTASVPMMEQFRKAYDSYIHKTQVLGLPHAHVAAGGS